MVSIQVHAKPYSQYMLALPPAGSTGKSVPDDDGHPAGWPPAFHAQVPASVLACEFGSGNALDLG